MAAKSVKVVILGDATSAAAAFNQVSNTADAAGGKFESVGSKLAGFAGKVAAVGAAFAGAAIVGGLTAGVKAGIAFNSAIEQTTVSLTTMLGSQEQANALIAEMTAFAAKTPYEFPELADSTKKLLAFGVSQKDIIPTMTTLGDISAGLGINVGELAEIYGKAKVQGRLFAEDVNQLTGRGIPVIQEFAKQFGVTESEVRGLVEQGKIGFPELQTALQSMTSEGGKFGGMMAAQAQTMAGQWSTLKDTINQTMGQVMKPVFDWLTGTVLPAAIELLDKFTAGFAEGGLLGGIKAMFAGVGESMGGFMTTLKGMYDSIAPVFKGIYDTVAAIISQIAETVKPIVAAIADWIRAHWDEISAVTSAIWETVKAVISTALELIQKGVSVALDAIKAFWDAHGDKVMAVVTFVWDTVRTVVTTVMEAIREVMGAIMDAINGDWSAAWDHLKAAGEAIWNGIKSLAVGVFNGLKAALSAIWDGIKGAFQGLWDDCKSAWDTAAEWIGAIPGKIKGFFSGAASWLTDIGRSIMDGLLSGIKSAWNSVANFLSGLGAKIKALKGPIQEDRKLLIPEGEAIMEGLGIGLDNGWNAIEAKLAKYGKDIKAWGSSLHSVQDVVPGTTGGSIAAPSSSVVGQIGISNNGAAPEDTRFAKWGKFTGDIDKLVANGGEYVRGSGQLPSMVYDGRGHWLTTTNQPGQPSATVSPTTGADSRVININVSGASGIDVGRQIANVLATV